MAGLRPTGSDGCDRAQLLLVGAFALAVLVVALALVTNGAAQTETLATDRTDAGDLRDAVRFRDDVRRGLGGIVDTVNRNGDDDYGALRDDLNASVEEWERLAARGSAGDGVGVSVELTNDPLTSDERGSRISQTPEREFTDSNGTANWRLASSVDRTRAFEVNVSRANLSSGCGGCFTVVAENGTATWRAQFTRGPSEIQVAVDGPTGAETCTIPADSTVVDLSAGTVPDRSCSFPAFAEGLGGPYNITYQNGDAGTGTYALVIDTDEPLVDDSPYAATGPSLSRAIYSADVTVRYRTPSLTYTTTVRVTPGDGDA
jgi:hypothetical protein